MADDARKKTDKILAEMEKEVDKIYRDASKEISEKWEQYMETHKDKVESAYKDLQDAIASGDQDAIREARATYERTVKNVTLNNDRYKAMVKETSAKLSHTNEVALNYVNDNMAKIYTLNYNEFANEKVSGYTFTLVNEQAVKNLARSDKALLPHKDLDEKKDERWNEKLINSQMMQGILQGENIPKMAKRLETVVGMDKNASIRNARTMTTSAENKGRQDSFKKAAEDGVILKRRWVATHDDRTRAAHIELDGEEVDLDEPWENEYGEIMYPGDPTADAANVYNCRCSIRSIVVGFKWNEQEEPAEEEFVPDINNVDEFDGKENVIKSLEDLDKQEAETWNDYISGTKYNIINAGEQEQAFYDPANKEVTLFDYSSQTTFFHETAHALDEESVTGSVEITGKRLVDGEWIESKPYTYEFNGASRAAQEIYDMNENSWSQDNEAFMKWSGMKDEDDVKSLVHSVREFEKQYGEDAGMVLGDIIDAHTIGKYPMSVFSGGHGESYWSRDASLISSEAFAEIASLKAAGNQEAIDAISNIFPNRVGCEETIYNMIFKGDGEYEHKESTGSGTRISETVWRFRKKS